MGVIKPFSPGAVDSISGGNETIGGNKIWTGRANFGSSVTDDPRKPFKSSQGIGPAGEGTLDHVAHLFQSIIVGDWTNDTGTNPKYAWGTNFFTVTGSGNTDGNGMTHLYGALIEADVRAGAGTTITNVIGLQVEASFFGASSSANVGTISSLRVARPTRKDGAVAGTATNVYGIFVEAVDATIVGSTADKGYSLYVSGGNSFFGGNVDVGNNEIFSKTVTVAATVPGGGSTLPSNRGRLYVQSNGAGNSVFSVQSYAGAAQTADPIRLLDGPNPNTVYFAVNPTGQIFMKAGGAPTARSGYGGVYVASDGSLRFRGPTTDTLLAPA